MKTFLYSSSVYSCHLLLISSASLSLYHFCPLLCPSVHEIFPWYFLEEISTLFHSVVFLHFYALIIEEGFLISPCYSLELCIQMCVFFLFSFALCFSSFLSSLDNHFAFLHFFFLRLVLITACLQCPKPPSIVLQAFCLSNVIPWISFSLPLYNRKGFHLVMSHHFMANKWGEKWKQW